MDSGSLIINDEIFSLTVQVNISTQNIQYSYSEYSNLVLALLPQTFILFAFRLNSSSVSSGLFRQYYNDKLSHPLAAVVTFFKQSNLMSVTGEMVDNVFYNNYLSSEVHGFCIETKQSQRKNKPARVFQFSSLFYFTLKKNEVVLQSLAIVTLES